MARQYHNLWILGLACLAVLVNADVGAKFAKVAEILLDNKSVKSDLKNYPRVHGIFKWLSNSGHINFRDAAVLGDRAPSKFSQDIFLRSGEINFESETFDILLLTPPEDSYITKGPVICGRLESQFCCFHLFGDQMPGEKRNEVTAVLECKYGTMDDQYLTPITSAWRFPPELVKRRLDFYVKQVQNFSLVISDVDVREPLNIDAEAGDVDYEGFQARIVGYAFGSKELHRKLAKTAFAVYRQSYTEEETGQRAHFFSLSYLSKRQPQFEPFLSPMHLSHENLASADSARLFTELGSSGLIRVTWDHQTTKLSNTVSDVLVELKSDGCPNLFDRVVIKAPLKDSSSDSEGFSLASEKVSLCQDSRDKVELSYRLQLTDNAVDIPADFLNNLLNTDFDPDTCVKIRRTDEKTLLLGYRLVIRAYSDGHHRSKPYPSLMLQVNFLDNLGVTYEKNEEYVESGEGVRGKARPTYIFHDSAGTINPISVRDRFAILPTDANGALTLILPLTGESSATISLAVRSALYEPDLFDVLEPDVVFYTLLSKVDGKTLKEGVETDEGVVPSGMKIETAADSEIYAALFRKLGTAGGADGPSLIRSSKASGIRLAKFGYDPDSSIYDPKSGIFTPARLHLPAKAWKEEWATHFKPSDIESVSKDDQNEMQEQVSECENMSDSDKSTEVVHPKFVKRDKTSPSTPFKLREFCFVKVEKKDGACKKKNIKPYKGGALGQLFKSAFTGFSWAVEYVGKVAMFVVRGVAGAISSVFSIINLSIIGQMLKDLVTAISAVISSLWSVLKALFQWKDISISAQVLQQTVYIALNYGNQQLEEVRLKVHAAKNEAKNRLEAFCKNIDTFADKYLIRAEANSGQQSQQAELGAADQLQSQVVNDQLSTVMTKQATDSFLGPSLADVKLKLQKHEVVVYIRDSKNRYLGLDGEKMIFCDNKHEATVFTLIDDGHSWRIRGDPDLFLSVDKDNSVSMVKSDGGSLERQKFKIINTDLEYFFALKSLVDSKLFLRSDVKLTADRENAQSDEHFQFIEFDTKATGNRNAEVFSLQFDTVSKMSDLDFNEPSNNPLNRIPEEFRTSHSLSPVVDHVQAIIKNWRGLYLGFNETVLQPSLKPQIFTLAFVSSTKAVIYGRGRNFLRVKGSTLIVARGPITAEDIFVISVRSANPLMYSIYSAATEKFWRSDGVNDPVSVDRGKAKKHEVFAIEPFSSNRKAVSELQLFDNLLSAKIDFKSLKELPTLQLRAVLDITAVAISIKRKKESGDGEFIHLGEDSIQVATGQDQASILSLILLSDTYVLLRTKSGNFFSAKDSDLVSLTAHDAKAGKDEVFEFIRSNDSMFKLKAVSSEKYVVFDKVFIYDEKETRATLFSISIVQKVDKGDVFADVNNVTDKFMKDIRKSLSRNQMAAVNKEASNVGGLKKLFKNIGRNIMSGLGQFLKLLSKIALVIATLALDLLGLVVDFMKLVFSAFKKVFETRIKIPTIGSLMGNLFRKKGQPSETKHFVIDIGYLFCVVLAVPFTAGYKAFKKRAPFDEQDVEKFKQLRELSNTKKFTELISMMQKNDGEVHLNDVSIVADDVLQPVSAEVAGAADGVANVLSGWEAEQMELISKLATWGPTVTGAFDNVAKYVSWLGLGGLVHGIGQGCGAVADGVSSVIAAPVKAALFITRIVKTFFTALKNIAAFVASNINMVCAVIELARIKMNQAASKAYSYLMYKWSFEQVRTVSRHLLSDVNDATGVIKKSLSAFITIVTGVMIALLEIPIHIMDWQYLLDEGTQNRISKNKLNHAMQIKSVRTFLTIIAIPLAIITGVVLFVQEPTLTIIHTVLLTAQMGLLIGATYLSFRGPLKAISDEHQQAIDDAVMKHKSKFDAIIATRDKLVFKMLAHLNSLTKTGVKDKFSKELLIIAEEDGDRYADLAETLPEQIDPVPRDKIEFTELRVAVE